MSDELTAYDSEDEKAYYETTRESDAEKNTAIKTQRTTEELVIESQVKQKVKAPEPIDEPPVRRIIKLGGRSSRAIPDAATTTTTTLVSTSVTRYKPYNNRRDERNARRAERSPENQIVVRRPRSPMRDRERERSRSPNRDRYEYFNVFNCLVLVVN